MDGINWNGLSRIQNPFANFAEGMQMGADMRQQRQRNELLAQRQAFEIDQARRQQAQEDQDRARKANVGAAVARGDYAGARTAAEGDFDMLKAIGELDKDQREAAKAKAQDLGGFALALKNVPYEQRRAILQQAQATLTSYGFTPEQLAAFDPTDQALDAQAASAMDIKTALEEANRLRDDARAQEKAKADEAYRAKMLSQGERRIGLAADANRRGWASFNERKKAGGFGTPGVGAAGIADDDVEIDP